jgi:hypothetical protein
MAGLQRRRPGLVAPRVTSELALRDGAAGPRAVAPPGGAAASSPPAATQRYERGATASKLVPTRWSAM